jgi:tetratricopeptide (TPR) repeat protein
LFLVFSILLLGFAGFSAEVVVTADTNSPPLVNTEIFTSPITNPPAITSAAPVPSIFSEPTNSAVAEKTETVSNSNSIALPPVTATVAPATAPPNNFLIWMALSSVATLALVAIVFSLRPQRNSPTAALPVRLEYDGALAQNLLPLISLAVKEALVQELSVQRRELLAAQQSAAAELAELARRLEVIQTPLLERLRPAAGSLPRLNREIPVKIFCVCGQKYAFEIEPVNGRMPFAVECPACGQDGSTQANQFITRLLNGTTQLLPTPAPTSIPAMNGKNGRTPAPETKNGAGHIEDFVTRMLAEGQALTQAGEFEKAIKCFEAALVLQPERAETLVKIGVVLDKLNRADDALHTYDRALALDDSLTIAYLNKGGLFNRLARYDEALKCYEQALVKQKKDIAA